MDQDRTALRRHMPILFLCILLVILSVLGAILLRRRHVIAAFGNSPLPSPTEAARRQVYHSRFTETPIPTLPSPYLSSPAPTAAPAARPTPAPTAAGLLGGKYAWRFTKEEVLTDHTYSDPSISITWNAYRDELSYSRPVTFYVADVLLQDVTSLTTAFAKGSYSAGGRNTMEAIAKKNNCIVAISGDFARWHSHGLIVRNGEVFRQQRFSWDLGVLYKNGVLETYEPGTISVTEILEKDPWQSWHFGPELLDHNGQPKTKFNTTVGGRNPRSVIGYYEPGHYCLVLVDGRQGRYSAGLNMKELSQLMYTLGCVRAYNLDGGATAHMSWVDKVINSPSKGRKLNDVICVCFPSGS
ncbi:MAG: phosphodiester glycosidase family protein [Clostridia bacterium]|nr:phosphodiester glycosidase family protein [Clostridia bacterium]